MPKHIASRSRAGQMGAAHARSLDAHGQLAANPTVIGSAVAAVDFTALWDSTLEEVEFRLDNVLSSTDSRSLWLRTSADAGATFAAGASDYAYAALTNSSASATPAGNASTGGFPIRPPSPPRPPPGPTSATPPRSASTGASPPPRPASSCAISTPFPNSTFQT